MLFQATCVQVYKGINNKINLKGWKKRGEGLKLADCKTSSFSFKNGWIFHLFQFGL